MMTEHKDVGDLHKEALMAAAKEYAKEFPDQYAALEKLLIDNKEILAEFTLLIVTNSVKLTARHIWLQGDEDIKNHLVEFAERYIKRREAESKEGV